MRRSGTHRASLVVQVRKFTFRFFALQKFPLPLWTHQNVNHTEIQFRFQEKKLARVAVIRDSIKRRVEKLIAGIENNEILENAPKE